MPLAHGSEIAGRVEVRAAQRLHQVRLGVGHVGEIDLLQVPEVVHLLGQVIGGDQQAAAPGITLLELRLNLPKNSALSLISST